MNKIMDFVVQLVTDDSNRYPGLMKRHLGSQSITDPITWADSSILFDSPEETHTINLRNL